MPASAPADAISAGNAGDSSQQTCSTALSNCNRSFVGNDYETSPAVAGSVGAATRRQYTAIGDTGKHRLAVGGPNP